MALLVNGRVVGDDVIAQQYGLLAEAFSIGAGRTIDAVLQQQMQRTAEENAIFQEILFQRVAESAFQPSAKEVASAVEQYGHIQGAILSDQERARIEQDLRTDRVIREVTRNVPRPSARELESVYRETVDRYREPERVRVRHIIKNVDGVTSEEKALQRIEEAQAALRSGTRFERVADEYSDCPGNGGDIGWVARNEMVREFEDQVFAMRPGEVSGIFRSGFGFHIALVVARQPARTRPFSEVRGEVGEALMASRRQNALVMYLRGEAERADIRVVREAAKGQ